MSVSFVTIEKQDAAFELIGAVQGLIDQRCVPDYTVDFLQSRLDRLRRAYGMVPRERVVRSKESADARTTGL